jgi:hypothetical protein
LPRAKTAELTGVYPGIMPVDLFEDDPGSCAYGHYFGPGKVRRGCMPCGCEAAQGNNHGHHYIVCNACEAEGRREWIFLPPCSDDCELPSHDDGQGRRNGGQGRLDRPRGNTQQDRGHETNIFGPSAG